MTGSLDSVAERGKILAPVAFIDPRLCRSAYGVGAADHANPRSECLITMYEFINRQDIQKRPFRRTSE
jgi:hypothetical protein